MATGFEKGDVYHLPYSGGILQQPNKTLKCWIICRSVLLEHITEENKKAMNKMKSRGAH